SPSREAAGPDGGHPFRAMLRGGCPRESAGPVAGFRFGPCSPLLAALVACCAWPEAVPSPPPDSLPRGSRGGVGGGSRRLVPLRASARPAFALGVLERAEVVEAGQVAGQVDVGFRSLRGVLPEEGEGLDAGQRSGEGEARGGAPLQALGPPAAGTGEPVAGDDAEQRQGEEEGVEVTSGAAPVGEGGDGGDP